VRVTLTPAATAEVPTHQLAVCRELVDDYGVDGLELDWTCDQNFFAPAALADGSAAATTTAFMRAVATVAHAGPGRPALVGAWVYQEGVAGGGLARHRRPTHVRRQPGLCPLSASPILLLYSIWNVLWGVV
jgi:hypothetical protein